MAQTYTINGTDYSFPDVDDSDWGQNVTDWAGAVSSFLLQRSGGTFTLGAVVDFGTGYGLKIKDLESKTSNASEDTSAFLRMAKGDYISWRNNAEGADLALKKNTSDRLEFATKELINIDATQTMSSKTLTSPVINTGISGSAIDNNTSLGSSSTVVPTQNAVKSYVDAQVTASDLDFSGDSGGAQSVDLDSQSLTVEGGTGVDTTGSAQKVSIAIDSSVTTNSGTQTLTNKTLTSPKLNEDVALSATSTYLNRMDATSSVQTQLDSKQATITGAATTITGADLSTSKVLQSNGSGKVEASSVTTTTLGYLDASSSVQTQLDAKAALSNPNFTGYADFNTISAPGAPGTSGQTRLYSTAGKLYFHGNGGSETEIGAGGGGAGDADTIQLKTAEASEGTGSAPWYTGNDLVPGGGGSIGGTWELSTSNPLINTNDATKVFHYSNATSNRKGDYFEIELDVPNYAKGHNLVVQLFYRTVGAEDTDFLFFARDRTADYSTEANGVQSATNNVVVDSSTGFAVGDRICFEDSSNARHFRYVTAVPDPTHVTFSGAAAAFADNAAIVTKFFTDELDYITAENNTTNYEGKIRKWAFQINDTTTKIRVGFLYDNSATSTNELFFDQILLSSNQFLQTSSQGQSECYSAVRQDDFWETYGTVKIFNFGLLLPLGGGPTLSQSKLIEVLDEDSRTKIKARQDIVLSAGVLAALDSSAYIDIKDKNDGVLVREQQFNSSNYESHANITLNLSKGDFIYFESNDLHSDWGGATITATPQVNDVVLLNSSDEIFTDWVSYTPSLQGLTGGTNRFYWRRNGPNMEIMVHHTGGSADSNKVAFGIPSGYTINQSYFRSDYSWVGHMIGGNTNGAHGYSYFVNSYDGDYEKIYIGYASSSTAPFNPATGSALTGLPYSGFVTVPIAGWSSTFNPVLSMPLVNIGNDMEEFLAFQMAAPLAQYAAFGWDEVQKDTTGSLLSIANASTALIATAQQRCLVHISWTQSADGAVWNYIVKNGTSGTDPQLLTYGTSTNSQAAYTGGGGEAQNIKGAWILEPGDTIYTASSGTGFYDSSYRSNLSIVAVRDRGNTNMAHIIKPAVARVIQLKDGGTAASTGGGTTGTDVWNVRVLNSVSGESWFFHTSTFDGRGGTNTTFQLEPGMYEVQMVGPTYHSNYTAVRLATNRGSGTTYYGVPNSTGGGTYQSSGSVYVNSSVVFTLTNRDEKFRIEQWSANPLADEGLGTRTNSASVDGVFTQMLIRKLK